MPVAPMFYVPRNADDLTRLLWFNFDHHRQVSRWIAANKNLNVQQFDLYPAPPEGLAGWLLQHQSWHSQIDAVLGVRSNNLLVLPLHDKEGFAAWVFLHASEHQAWQMATGAT